MLKIRDFIDKIIIKRKVLADTLDRELYTTFNLDMNEFFQMYKDAHNATDSYMGYQFTINELKDFCDNPVYINKMVNDNSLIPMYIEYEDIEKLLIKKRSNVINTYRELNNYYRMYLGLPPLMVDEKLGLIENPNFIFYTKIPVAGVDITKPVHQFTPTERTLFGLSGNLDKLIVEHPNAIYLRYLDRNIDVLDLRGAKEYEVMWYDNTDNKIIKFKDHYRAIRNKYMSAHNHLYDDAVFDYVEGLSCIFLLISAMADYNASLPLERLDNQSIEEADLYKLFESFGVPKWDFSTKYLNKIAGRIQMLHYKKGSKDVLHEISKLFDEITIFKYFIVKRLKDSGNANVDGLEDKDKYELFFVKTPLDCDDPYLYFNEGDSTFPYHYLVDKDPKWGLGEDKLDDKIKSMPFSYSESKYLSLDNKIDVFTFSLEMAYFYRYILENKKVAESLKFYVDTVDVNANLFEILTYMQVLVMRKYKVAPDIPDTMSSILYMYSIKKDLDYDRLKLIYREYFKYHKPPQEIDRFVQLLDNVKYGMNDLINGFEVNWNILKDLYELRRNTRKYEDFEIIDETIRAITYGEKMPQIYNNKTNLEDFLSTYSDYSNKFLVRIAELESSSDARASINNEITTVINLLRENIDNIRHKNLMSLLDSGQVIYSDLDVLDYVVRIIDFYKSYTQDLIDSSVSYTLTDWTDNLHILESLKIQLDLSEYDMYQLSLIFTTDSNEIVRFLTDHFVPSDSISICEQLSIVKGKVHQEIIANSNPMDVY